MQHYVPDPVKTRSLSKRLGLCDDSAEVVKTIIAQPENIEMKTNRETSAVPKPSHMAEIKIPHHPSNTSLLAEMDLSMSVDESFEASVTTQEASICDIEPPREDSESPEAREGSVSPCDTDWSEHEPVKRRRTENRVGKLKPCDICGKLLTANHLRRHQRSVHGMNNTNPPSQPVINSLETSQVLSKEPRVYLENINSSSLRITPDDPCKGRRKMSLIKKGHNTYRILGNPAKKKVTKKKRNPQTCPFCGMVSGDRYDLIRHCSRLHLKEHLMEYINQESLTCTLCGLKRGSIGELLSHLGTKHKREKIEKWIEMEARACTENMESQETQPHEEGNQNNYPGNSEQPPFNEFLDTRLKCCHDDCSFETSKRLKLYRHYSTEHYRRQLSEHLNGEDSITMTCKFCNILIRKKTDMIAHIGSVHGKVEQYIPKEHRISLSSKSILSESINERFANGDENKNDKNSDSIKDDRSPSPTENIISVETVELPEPLPSTLNPDDDCQINFDLKIERIESVPSDNNSGQIQEDNNKIKEDSPDNKVDLRRVLDSDSDTESDNE